MIGIGIGIGKRRGGGAVASAPVISDLVYSSGTNTVSLTSTVGSGTVYYILHGVVTPQTGAAIKAAPFGTINVTSGVVADVEDWAAQPNGTYYLQAVQETAGGFSNVLVLEVTILNTTIYDLAAYLVEPTNLGSLWQDTAGTVAITGTGQSVARADNLGTAGGNFVNTGATDRPVLTVAGGLNYLQFDGTNDYLKWLGTNGDIALSGGYYIIAVMEEATANSLKGFLSIAGTATSGYNHSSGVQIDSNLNSTNAVYAHLGTDNTSGLQLFDASAATLAKAIVEIEVIPATGAVNGWLRVRRVADGDLVQMGTDTALSGTHPNTATAAGQIVMGSRIVTGAPSNFANIRHYGFALIEGLVDADQKALARAWAVEKAGF